MFQNKRILALIPARGGSKGIPGKNITPLDGKPLIAWSIEPARESHYIDSVVVSTDSPEIADVARKYGADVPFMRPANLAADTSRTVDAVLHAVHALKNIPDFGKYDALVLLQPTQPLRTTDDIDSAIECYFAHMGQSLVSVSPVTEHPLLIRSIGSEGTLVPVLNADSTCRRQDMPPFYRVNGCIYINCIAELTENTSFNDNVIPFVMPPERSVDIDEPDDLAYAEWLLKKNRNFRDGERRV